MKRAPARRKGGRDDEDDEFYTKSKIIDVEESEKSLQEMFPTCDRSLVKHIFECNDYNIESTIEQLAALIEAEDKRKDRQELENEQAARDLAVKIEKEEERRRKAQEQRDAALARRLLSEDQGGASTSTSTSKRKRRKKKNKNADAKEPPPTELNEPEARPVVPKSTPPEEKTDGWTTVKKKPQKPKKPPPVPFWKVGMKEGKPYRGWWPAFPIGAASPPSISTPQRETTHALDDEEEEGALISKRTTKRQRQKKEKEATTVSSERQETTTPSDGGMKSEFLGFIRSIFPRLDERLLDSVFTENSCNLERTIESLLSLNTLAEEGQLTSSEEDEEGSGGGLESGLESEEQEETPDNWDFLTYDEHEAPEDDLAPEHREAGHSVAPFTPQHEHGEDNPNNTRKEPYNWQASKFTINLKELADMFPDFERPMLAMALEQNDDDIEKTIEALLPQSLLFEEQQELKKKEGAAGRKISPRPTQVTFGSKWGAKQNEVLHKLGSKPEYQNKSTREGAAVQEPPSPETPQRVADFSTRFKFKELREKFKWIDIEVLASVFHYNGYNLAKTTAVICDLYNPVSTVHTGKEEDGEVSQEAHGETFWDDSVVALGQERKDDSAANETKPQSKAARNRAKRQRAKEKKKQAQFTLVEKKRIPKPEKRTHQAAISDNEGRQAVLDHADLRAKYYMLATRAYMSGDGKAAAEFSRKGREQEALMQAAAVRTCDAIFSNRREQLQKVDLHKLHVPVAMTVLRRLLQVHGSSKQPGPIWISVITGIGRHSADGKPRIKPAVIEFLRDNKYTFRENGGLIVIRVK